MSDADSRSEVWPVYFEALLDGSKTFEVRRDDRGFKVGDLLRLHEYDPDHRTFTSRRLVKEVTFVLNLGDWVPGGHTAEYAVLGLKDAALA